MATQIIHTGENGLANQAIGPESTVPRILYVDGTIGSDSYDGSSPTVDGNGVGPKATARGAKALIPFIRRQDFLIKIAAGTYAEPLIIDGIGNSIAYIGGYTVEQTGTLTSLDDGTNPGPINPCGFYQATIAWDGGFTLTDLVDDEKFFLIELLSGEKIIYNCLQVLGAGLAEIAAKFYTGKVVADYVGASVSLIVPNVVFEDVGSALVAMHRPGISEKAATWDGPDSGPLLFGIDFHTTGADKAAAVVDTSLGTFGNYFTRFLADDGYGLFVEESNIWWHPATYSTLSTAGLAAFTTLTDGLVVSENYVPAGIVCAGDAGTKATNLVNCAGGKLTFVGVFKGANWWLASVINEVTWWNVVWYRPSSTVFAPNPGVYLGRFASFNHLVRKGTVIFTSGYLGLSYSVGWEFRSMTSRAISFTNGCKANLDSFPLNIASSYAGSPILIQDSDVLIVAGLIEVTAHATGQKLIDVINSKFKCGAEIKAPVQDYGAAPSKGIIVADQDSQVTLMGKCSGQNTNVGVSSPLVLRRGSTALLDVDAVTPANKYNLLDQAGAQGVYLGSVGATVAPVADASQNDCVGAGTDEMCRVSSI
jgi:hypothetical protein